MSSCTLRIAFVIVVASLSVLAPGPCLAKDESAQAAPRPPIKAATASRALTDRIDPAAAPEDAGAPPHTLQLRLSAGLAMISVPVVTESRKLSELLPGLPGGSRAWKWSAPAQQWVEGFDQELALGQGVLLYLPEATVLTFKGQPTRSSRTPVELANGWNLVGVPHVAPFPLSAQSAWGNGVETAFGDAAQRGLVGRKVFALEGGGYKDVGGAAMLQPTRAYWVYAKGADLMTMRPALLGDLAKEFAWWTAKQAGAAGFSYGAGQLIALISPDPNQPILDKIDAMTRQLDDVQRTQQRILDQFADTNRKISMTEAQILGAVGEVNVKNVRADVAAHFDDLSNQNASFMYFAQQAKSAEGRRLVTQENKVAFARNVLGTWNFVKQFNDVQEAIAPSGDALGVLDNFADRIVLSGAANSTLEDRYRAMESYFNGLVGLQVKIMTLLTNSWNTLAEVPGSGYSTTFADEWRRTTYTAALAKQALRFRDASERVMAGSLRVSSEMSDAPVSVPPEVVNTIVPRVDFGVMQLANEPPGVRVRVFAGRYMNESNTYSIVDGAGRPILALPSFDSGYWKTMPASTQAWDSWRVRGRSATFDSRNAEWELYRDNAWIMYRTTVPMNPGTYSVRLVDAWKVTDDNDTPALYGLRTFQAGAIDEANRPVAGGQLFGSLILAKRAAARTALRVYNDGASSAWNNCRPQSSMGKEHDYFIISGNCYGGGWSSYQRLVPFYFMGPEASAAGDWQMAIRTSLAGCGARDQNVCANSYSLGQIELLDNDNSFSKIVRFDSASQTSYHASIRWDKAHVYKLHLRLVHTGTSNAMASQVWRGGLVIRFNPTP